MDLVLTGAVRAPRGDAPGGPAPASPAGPRHRVPSATMRLRRPEAARSAVLPVLVALGLLGAACGSSPPGSSAPATAPVTSTTAAAHVPAVAPPPAVTWTTCPTHAGIQCGTVPVPLDYDDPAAGTIEVAVSRIPATGGAATDGVLLINPGGPGESGNQILPIEYPLLPAGVRATMDVVSFDPRGTGASDPLQCGTGLSAVTSALPVPSSTGAPLPGTPVFTGIHPACTAADAALTGQVDTVDTARDMDRIRQALGVARVSFYGLSYGTVLGTMYASLFPQPGADHGPGRRRRPVRVTGHPGHRTGSGGRAVPRPPAGGVCRPVVVPARERPDGVLRPPLGVDDRPPAARPRRRRRRAGHGGRPRHGDAVRRQCPGIHPALRQRPGQRLPGERVCTALARPRVRGRHRRRAAGGRPVGHHLQRHHGSSRPRRRRGPGPHTRRPRTRSSAATPSTTTSAAAWPGPTVPGRSPPSTRSALPRYS